MNTASRAQAVQKALDKYRGTAFAWGDTDCLHLARTVLVGIGAKGLPRLPRYSTERAALRQLKKQGHYTLESLLAEYCIEIPPAMAVPGDVATIQGEGALSAIVVCAGGKWLGWPADADGPHFGSLTLTPDRVFRYV